jgi:hypothetical protein
VGSVVGGVAVVAKLLVWLVSQLVY